MTDKLRRFWGALNDPRTSAFLVNMAHALAQPRVPGQTGTMQATDALLRGYQGMAVAAELMRQRALQEAELQQKRRMEEAQLRKTEAETENITERTRQLPAQVGAETTLRQAQAELAKARAQHQTKATELLTQQVNADTIRAEAAKLGAETDARRLEIELSDLERRRQEADRRYELEKAKLAELIRSNKSKEAIDRQRLELDKAKLEADKALIDAKVKQIAADYAAGKDESKIYGDLVKTYFSVMARSDVTFEKRPPQEWAEEAAEWADSVISQLRKHRVVLSEEVERYAAERGISLEEAKRRFEELGYTIK